MKKLLFYICVVMSAGFVVSAKGADAASRPAIDPIQIRIEWFFKSASPGVKDTLCKIYKRKAVFISKNSCKCLVDFLYKHRVVLRPKNILNINPRIKSIHDMLCDVRWLVRILCKKLSDSKIYLLKLAVLCDVLREELEIVEEDLYKEIPIFE